jgi:hypothetical protein
MANGTIFKKPTTKKEYENPEVLIQGYGRMNLDTIKKKIARDHDNAARHLKTGQFESYIAVMTMINELIEAVMDVEKEMLRPSYKRLKHRLQEEPANAVGGGNIAGLGVGPQGEPGLTPKQARKYKRRNQKEFTAFINRKTKP